MYKFRRAISVFLASVLVFSTGAVNIYADDIVEEVVVEEQGDASDSECSEECYEITVVEVSTSEEIVPEEIVAEETGVEEIAPEETVPEEAAPEGTTPEEAISTGTTTQEENTAPEETFVPEEIAPEETKAPETVVEVKPLEQDSDIQGANTLASNDNNASDYNNTALNYVNGIRDTYTKTVENVSTSLSSTGRYNVYFTLNETNDRTGEKKTYIYTVSGFKSEAKAKSYAEIWGERLNATPSLMLTYTDLDLVDAEKKPWSYRDDLEKDPSTTIHPPYDSNLCWAGSVSDMLELSGWNKATLINNHGINVSDEDYLYDLFADNFTDYAGNQIYGVRWFFNGINIPESWDGWAHLKSEEGYTDAFLRDYCVDNFVRSNKYPTEDGLIDTLKTLDCDEDGDRCTIGLVFGYYNKDGNDAIIRNGGHCVTIVGYSTDEKGVPNSITIADSDSYNGRFPGYSEDGDRRTYENMYNTYPIEFYNGSWHIMNFCDSDYADTKIDDLIVLKYYSDNTKDKVEQGGTKDLVNYYDFYTDYERMFQNNINKTVETVYQGELLNAAFALLDYSICNRVYMDKIPYRFVLSKDGEVIRVIDAAEEVSADNNGIGYYYYTTIMDKEHLLEPGEYYISFIVNYDRSVAEAYYNNNQSEKPLKFIVLKRIDKNGEESYVVVPESSSSDSESDRNTVTEFIQNVVDYSMVTDSLSYFTNPEKVFEFHFSNGFAEMNISDSDIETADVIFDYSVTGDLSNPNGGNISSNISITKDDFKIIRNEDGTVSILFTNEFMRKLPKGTHYFKLRIGGKVRIFKIEIR